MATYYVRTDGSDTNTGTGPATNQAWQTIGKALGAFGIAPGDTVYIAPGVYRESVTAAFTDPTSEAQRVTIAGNPTASQFSGVSAGPVILTNFTSSTATTGNPTLLISKSFVTITGLNINGYVAGGGGFTGQFFRLGGQSGIITDCGFYTPTNNADINSAIALRPLQGLPGFTISRCITLAPIVLGPTSGTTTAWNSQTTITDCILQNSSVYTNSACVLLFNGVGAHFGGITIQNCRFIGNAGVLVYAGQNMPTTFPTDIKNCIFDTVTGVTSNTNNGQLTESYNIFNCGTARTNVGTGTGSLSRAYITPDFNLSRINGWGNYPFWSNHSSSASQNAGTSTGAPAADIYGVTWLAPSTPTMGAIEYSNGSNTGTYVPTERNASTITIAPGSTSQSIELYLGATGLTASTSGLSARYNRTRTTSVSIPLVARTIAQAWTSGGFAEVDATNMSGIYRLDLPDAALAAGADDVTVVVRGASGTNGAVMTVKLSSGGLTEAQTASAVWGASPGPYNDATTMGGIVNEIDTLANGIDINVTQTPILVWDELKSNHTTPGTFGDYLDAKVSDVADTARIQLRQGPFLIKQNAVDSIITEVNQFLSTTPNIEMVLIDSSGGSVSVAGSTLVMRVRNQAGTAVINNITPTVAYADGGVVRWSPNQSWNALGVTTAGTYRIVVERTIGGVTTTFGPFLVQLSSG
jgi:hypothetical protein